jgi:cytochrome P450
VSPDAVKHLLVTNYQSYDKHPRVLKIVHPVTGGLIMTPHGEQWRKDRTLFDQAFRGNYVVHMQSVVREVINKSIEKFTALSKSGEVADLQVILECLTFDIIGKIAMGRDFNSLGDSESKLSTYWSNSLEVLMWKFSTEGFPYWKYVKTPWLRRGEEDLKKLGELTQEIILSHKVTEDDMTLLGVMLRENEKNPGSYSVEDIQRHMMTFLFAGHDTTANALLWVFYYLMVNPEVEKKVMDEINQVLGNRDPSLEDFEKMEYLNCVVKETLRLKPSAPWFPARQVVQDEEFLGFKLLKGTFATFSSFASHHNPAVWKDPESFIPERFLPENYQKIPAYAYIPFGAGPRRCIGEQLALREIKLATVAIARKFRLKLEPGQVIDHHARLTMCAKNGILVTVEEREVEDSEPSQNNVTMST